MWREVSHTAPVTSLQSSGRECLLSSSKGRVTKVREQRGRWWTYWQNTGKYADRPAIPLILNHTIALVDSIHRLLNKMNILNLALIWWVTVPQIQGFTTWGLTVSTECTKLGSEVFLPENFEMNTPGNWQSTQVHKDMFYGIILCEMWPLCLQFWNRQANNHTGEGGQRVLYHEKFEIKHC